MPFKRQHQSGFTLLEALLAGAVLALLAIPTMAAFARAADQTGPRIAQFELHAFAVSMLEEKSAIRDFVSENGIYEDRFIYQIDIVLEPSLQATRYNDLIRFVKMTITITDADFPDRAISISQIFARKSEV